MESRIALIEKNMDSLVKGFSLPAKKLVHSCLGTELVEGGGDKESLLRRAEENERIQSYENLFNCIKLAVEDIECRKLPIEDESLEKNKQIDRDWITRWRREAKVIGKEDVQRIWARILVEETMKPGSISFRTLNVLSAMTSEDANIFNKITKFSLNGDIISIGYNINYPKLSFSFEECQQLKEAGLIMNVNDVFHEGYEYGAKERIFYGKGFCIIVECASEKIMVFPAHMLTTAGRELLELSSYESPDDEEIGYMYKFVEDRINTFSLDVKRITIYRTFDNNDIDYGRIVLEKTFSTTLIGG